MGAPTGVTETTMKPTPFPFPDKPGAILWDLQGAHTTSSPLETYIQKNGLRHFDVVVIVVGDRFTELDRTLNEHLKRHNVPVFVVRSKMDEAVANNLRDKGKSKEETMEEIRKNLTDNGVGSTEGPYLISSVEITEYDFERLVKDVLAAVAK